MMQGFGVNTFTLINSEGRRVFVKFVMTPELGVHSLVWDEALKLAGQDPGMLFARTLGLFPFSYIFRFPQEGPQRSH